MIRSWTIEGAEGKLIFGNSHLPKDKPKGVVLLVHGFKGYKDYGMFPYLAHVMSEAGFVTHRFNFSHSGMSNAIETFERPDLFEHNTYNKQIYDLRTVVEAINSGKLEGKGLGYVIFGHSMGGVTALLSAGRFIEDKTLHQPSGVITAATPSRSNFLTIAAQNELLESGYLVSPSARTGQKLRIGKDFLQEQIDDPEKHDLLKVASAIRCPALIVHGSNDSSVNPECAQEIVSSLGNRARIVIVERGL